MSIVTTTHQRGLIDSFALNICGSASFENRVRDLRHRRWPREQTAAPLLSSHPRFFLSSKCHYPRPLKLFFQFVDPNDSCIATDEYCRSTQETAKSAFELIVWCSGCSSFQNISLVACMSKRFNMVRFQCTSLISSYEYATWPYGKATPTRSCRLV